MRCNLLYPLAHGGMPCLQWTSHADCSPEVRGYGRPCQLTRINKVPTTQTHQTSDCCQARNYDETLKMNIVIVASLLAVTLMHVSQCSGGGMMLEHPQTSFCKADFGKFLFLKTRSLAIYNHVFDTYTYRHITC